MDYSKVVVITPTYNEKDNLPVLIEAIFGLGLNGISMLVVDDNSPDETGKIAERYAKKYPLKVLHRKEKMGLGTAYVEGFNDVLKGDFKYIILIDADMSHDPKDIKKLLEKIINYDLVIGSRYVKGGKTVNWSFMRKLISRFGNIYSKAILSLPYNDLTSGYRCFRREVLEKIDFDSLSSVGYGFTIETIYHADKNGFRIVEIPITFSERESGKSKFDLPIILESFKNVISLRLRGK